MPKVKWGLIGCGDIARRRVAPALRDLPNCQLTAVARSRYDLAEAFAREFGAERWYGDSQQLVADEEVEAVYIATPVNLHAGQAIAAAEAGKHVLCEKPMAMNVKECEQIIAACSANNVRLGVAYYRHFYPVIRRIKEILSSGEIGEPVITQMNAFERFAPEPSHPRRWLIEKEISGGGPMFDFGCHRIEVLMYLFGSMKSIKALTSNVLFEREVEDTASALFEFNSGPLAILTVTHAALEPQDTLNIYASGGSIHVDVLNKGMLKIRRGENESTEMHPPHQNLHQPLIDDFAEAILNNSEPEVSGRIGLEVAKVEEEIYVAAR